MIDLSIIIVSWNTREFLAACLNSLPHRAATLNLEIFVVDNASADGTPALVRRYFPQVQLIENAENVGFAQANNQAIELSRGRYLLLLNSDTQVHPGALETLVSFMDCHPQAGACGPRLLNADGTLQISCQPMLTPWREFWRLMFLERLKHRAEYHFSNLDFASSHSVETLKGACLLLRRTALNQTGLLDPRYFIYTEEIDLCYRLLQTGWRLFWLPTACVTHYGEASTRQLPETMYIQLYRSKIQFYQKFGGANRVRLFKLLLTCAYLPRWLTASILAPFTPTIAARARIYRRLLTALPGL